MILILEKRIKINFYLNSYNAYKALYSTCLQCSVWASAFSLKTNEAKQDSTMVTEQQYDGDSMMVTIQQNDGETGQYDGLL
jgi:hypothetical protein